MKNNSFFDLVLDEKETNDFSLFKNLNIYHQYLRSFDQILVLRKFSQIRKNKLKKKGAKNRNELEKQINKL